MLAGVSGRLLRFILDSGVCVRPRVLGVLVRQQDGDRAAVLGGCGWQRVDVDPVQLRGAAGAEGRGPGGHVGGRVCSGGGVYGGVSGAVWRSSESHRVCGQLRGDRAAECGAILPTSLVCSFSAGECESVSRCEYGCWEVAVAAANQQCAFCGAGCVGDCGGDEPFGGAGVLARGVCCSRIIADNSGVGISGERADAPEPGAFRIDSAHHHIERCDCWGLLV
mmetsp:Transcript_7024/g.11745  ORF Transcript_7024/g.11745 Transcript_7024/m.11745 type:complete len:222 (+) Transcript_7024:1056-1721(+)